MERTTCWGLVLAGAGLMLAGCQKPAPTGGAAPHDPPSQVQGAAGETPGADPVATPQPVRLADPAAAVTEFLAALRAGDDLKAEALLTRKAQQETAQADLAIKPPGSHTARFTVGRVEPVGDNGDGAHVVSTWSDTDPDGQVQTYEIIWILRRESDGWAVAGMATKLFEDALPLVFNFEEPQEMLRRREQAEQELARRAGEAEHQVQAQAPPPAGDGNLQR